MQISKKMLNSLVTPDSTKEQVPDMPESPLDDFMKLTQEESANQASEAMNGPPMSLNQQSDIYHPELVSQQPQHAQQPQQPYNPALTPKEVGRAAVGVVTGLADFPAQVISHPTSFAPEHAPPEWIKNMFGDSVYNFLSQDIPGTPLLINAMEKAVDEGLDALHPRDRAALEAIPAIWSKLTSYLPQGYATQTAQQYVDAPHTPAGQALMEAGTLAAPFVGEAAGMRAMGARPGAQQAARAHEVQQNIQRTAPTPEVTPEAPAPEAPLEGSLFPEAQVARTQLQRMAEERMPAPEAQPLGKVRDLEHEVNQLSEAEKALEGEIQQNVKVFDEEAPMPAGLKAPTSRGAHITRIDAEGGRHVAQPGEPMRRVEQKRVMTEAATGAEKRENKFGQPTTTDKQPYPGDRLQREANDRRAPISAQPEQVGVTPEFYAREKAGAERNMRAEEARRNIKPAELTPEEQRIVDEDKAYWSEREHQPDLYERNQQNIPDRPELTMGDMEGMAPENKRKLVKDEMGVEYFETPDGDIYAMHKGREIAFATKLGEDPAQGFDVSTSREWRRKGVGARVYNLFMRRNPGYPTGGLTRAGERMVKRAKAEEYPVTITTKDGEHVTTEKFATAKEADDFVEHYKALNPETGDIITRKQQNWQPKTPQKATPSMEELYQEENKRRKPLTPSGRSRLTDKLMKERGAQQEQFEQFVQLAERNKTRIGGTNRSRTGVESIDNAIAMVIHGSELEAKRGGAFLRKRIRPAVRYKLNGVEKIDVAEQGDGHLNLMPDDFDTGTIEWGYKDLQDGTFYDHRTLGGLDATDLMTPEEVDMYLAEYGIKRKKQDVHSQGELPLKGGLDAAGKPIRKARPKEWWQSENAKRNNQKFIDTLNNPNARDPNFYKDGEAAAIKRFGKRFVHQLHNAARDLGHKIVWVNMTIGAEKNTGTGGMVLSRAYSRKLGGGSNMNIMLNAGMEAFRPEEVLPHEMVHLLAANAPSLFRELSEVAKVDWKFAIDHSHQSYHFHAKGLTPDTVGAFKEEILGDALSTQLFTEEFQNRIAKYDPDLATRTIAKLRSALNKVKAVFKRYNEVNREYEKYFHNYDEILDKWAESIARYRNSPEMKYARAVLEGDEFVQKYETLFGQPHRIDMSAELQRDFYKAWRAVKGEEHPDVLPLSGKWTKLPEVSIIKGKDGGGLPTGRLTNAQLDEVATHGGLDMGKKYQMVIKPVGRLAVVLQQKQVNKVTLKPTGRPGEYVSGKSPLPPGQLPQSATGWKRLTDEMEVAKALDVEIAIAEAADKGDAAALNYLMKKRRLDLVNKVWGRKLIGIDANPKTIKGQKYGYKTGVMYLAPADISGREVCGGRSAGCTAACLNESGKGAMATVQATRISRTKRLWMNREKFLGDLREEIQALDEQAKAEGLKPVVRLNGTSDLPWEKYKLEGKTIMEHFPHIQFYDYTAIEKRAKKFAQGKMPDNYHITFSLKEDNEAAALRVLENGGVVAAVFRHGLPKKWKGFEVTNADANDLRFKDPKGTIAGLIAKGEGVKDKTGFVKDVPQEDIVVTRADNRKLAAEAKALREKVAAERKGGMTRKMQGRSDLTAIARTRPSTPMRWMHDKGFLQGRTLDYGSGKGKDAEVFGMDAYDPHHQPKRPTGNYDTITSNYVLNVLNAKERAAVIKDVKSLLRPGGTAYFTVRRDIKTEGMTSRGTYQENVVLPKPFELVKEVKGGFAIYKYTKDRLSLRTERVGPGVYEVTEFDPNSGHVAERKTVKAKTAAEAKQKY